MRGFIPFLPLILLAACGQRSDDRSQPADSQPLSIQYQPQAYDVQAPPATRVAAGPGVSPTAAPGVAFNYRYAFRLPGTRVAEVQERHAQTCERLGVSRCRITGMLYRVVNADTIEAMLALKLDPAIARNFGREGVAAVIGADGLLIESEISGNDAGAAILAAGRNIAEMEDRLRQIEIQLRNRSLSAADRANLEMQAQQLRQSIAANRAEREDQGERLANTPMVFNYATAEPVLEPGRRPTLNAAFGRALENFLDGATVLLVILLTLLPWALVIGLVWWIARKFVRRHWLEEAAPESGERGGAVVA